MEISQTMKPLATTRPQAAPPGPCRRMAAIQGLRRLYFGIGKTRISEPLCDHFPVQQNHSWMRPITDRRLNRRRKPRTRILVPGLMIFAVISSAHAAPPELADRVAAERPAGCTEYSFLFFRLYRAELWTDATELPGQNFGLSLVYRRGFKREELVSTSISEMARMSGRPESSFSAARAELAIAMRNVGEGDRYTSWRSKPGRVEFFHNGVATGVLTHDTGLFLDIWLGPGSRDQKRRATLLAGRCDE